MGDKEVKELFKAIISTTDRNKEDCAGSKNNTGTGRIMRSMRLRLQAEGHVSHILSSG
ncbi:MAG: hypothetical protein ACOX3A_08715 [bacterium]